MTICIGMDFGGLVLLAADTRRTDVYPDGTSSFKDGMQKIQDWGSGVIAGAGYVSLLDRVRERLRKTQISHINQIVEIIDEERNSILQSNSPAYRDAGKHCIATGWIFSYLTPDEDGAGPRVRLARIHGSIPGGIHTPPGLGPITIAPASFSTEAKTALDTRLKAAFKPLSHFDNAQACVGYAAKLVRILIEDISKKVDPFKIRQAERFVEASLHNFQRPSHRLMLVSFPLGHCRFIDSQFCGKNLLGHSVALANLS